MMYYYYFFILFTCVNLIIRKVFRIDSFVVFGIVRFCLQTF